MSTSSIQTVIGAHNIAQSILSLSSLQCIDYADQFTLYTPLHVLPESWARAMFGDSPTAAEKLIWRGLLGFRLSREASPQTIAGWKIGGRGEDWIRLEALSWFLDGNLIVTRREGWVSLVTCIYYRGCLGRVVWPPLAAVHRWVVPRVLRSALSKLRVSQ